MPPDSIEIAVPRDLEPLMPRFLANRRLEISRMQAFLAEGNFEGVRQVGHSLKGVGGSFGFHSLSELGDRIETHAKAQDKPALDIAVAEYVDFMARVSVRYV